MKRHFQCPLLVIALLASGCSGGGGGSFEPRGAASTASPAGPSATPGATTPAPAGQVRVTAQIATDGLPLFAARSRAAAANKRRALSTSYQSLEFTGTIYPGYAGTATQTATSILNTTTLPSSAGLAFASVPAGNNEWVVITVTAFTGQNGTGSSTPAGELGGLFNVGSSASVTVDNGSTLRLQLALAGMMDGLISTYELANQTSLDSDLGNFIGQSGVSPDPTTSLYTETTLTKLLQNLVSTYQRQLTIAGSVNSPSTAYVTWDYTNASELNYSTSVTETATSLMPFDVSLIHFPVITGNPNAGLMEGLATGVPPHVPSAGGTGLQRAVISDGFAAPGGTVTLGSVYGGALLVGVGSGYGVLSAFAGNGGFASVAGRARNTATTTKVTVSSSTFGLTQNDAEAFYLAQELYFLPALPYGETFAPIDNDFNLTCHETTCIGSQDLEYSQSSSKGPGNGQIIIDIDQFNPWALPTSDMALCITASGECLPVSSGGTVTSHLPFYSDTRYGGWPAVVPSSGAGATTAVTGPNFTTSPYSISYTGSSSGQTNGYVSINLGTGSAYFYGGQELDMTTSAPNGSTIYLNIGCGGTTYQFLSGVNNGVAVITISSFSGLVTCQSVTIGYSIETASNGSFTLGPILPPAGAM